MNIHTRIDTLIVEQVNRDGDSVAVESTGKTLTYHALNRHANELATQLVSFGIQPGECVAACLNRSTTQVVAMLAVMKARAIFVPLGFEYPPAMQREMFEQARARVMLTNQQSAALCPSIDGEVWVVDSATPIKTTRPPIGRVDRPTADDGAFILFTAGSTGLPKGVYLTHQSYCHLARVHRDELALTPNSRSLSFGSIAHGNAIATMVGSLVNGGTLCIEPFEKTLPGSALEKTLLERRITHLHLPPTSLNLLPQRRYPDLKRSASAVSQFQPFLPVNGRHKPNLLPVTAPQNQIGWLCPSWTLTIPATRS